MTNTGIISEINGGKVKIKVLRESVCGGNCESCSGCELKNHFIDADIKTELDFEPKTGDRVNIFMDDKLFYRYSFIGYALFVVFMILGAVAGYSATKDEQKAILCAFSGILLAFVVVKLCFKNKKSGLKITKIVEEK